MQKEAGKAEKQGKSLYLNKPVFAVAPMIDWTDFPYNTALLVGGSIFVAIH